MSALSVDADRPSGAASDPLTSKSFFRKIGEGQQLALIWAVFSILAFGSLNLLWRQSGWPQNHEFNSFVQRTQIYAAHYRFHDFVPIWSSVDNEGFGSPQPLLYHKLFYAVAATLFILTGSVKSALILAIFAFLLIGAWGIYFLMRALGARRLPSVIGGLSLIVANYTVMDWMVRCAVAEFSAYMLVPWTMYYLIRSVQQDRIQPGLGVMLGVTFVAHAVLSFYLGLLYATVLLILIAARQLPFRVELVKSGLVALAIFLAITLPYLLPMKIIGRDYDMSRELTYVYRPIYQFQPLHRYFWDSWRFGRTWAGFTIQIDLPLIALVITALFAMVFYNRPGLPGGRSRREALKAVLPFALLLVIALFLQARVTAGFYRWFPGAAFIQFPWRLLAVITPAAIVFGLYLVDALLPRLLARIVIVVFGMSMVLSSGAFAHIEYGRLETFDPPLAPLTLSVLGEFVPATAPAVHFPPLPAPLPYTLQQVLSAAEASGCSIEDGSPRTEVKKTEFHIHCQASSRIALPIYASRAHRLRIRSGGPAGNPTSCAPSPAELPGLCGVELPAGSSVVEMRFPTYPLFLRSLFSR